MKVKVYYTTFCEKVIEVDDKFGFLLTEEANDDWNKTDLYVHDLIYDAQEVLTDMDDLCAIWDEKGEMPLVEL